MPAAVPLAAEREGAPLPKADADVVLVGGGLANSLIALRLRTLRPELRVVMLERGSQDENSHTWSFFATDVDAATSAWLEPLVQHRWSGYDVLFPGHRRSLSTPYGSMTGDGLARIVDGALGRGARCGVRRGVEVVRLTAGAVETADGQRLTAPLVIDGRGARPSGHLCLAWQKFVGLELSLDAPHGLQRPVIMDATAPQDDGFRFLYLLPFDPRRVLVEDTRYSDGPELDPVALRTQVLAHAAARGWRVATIEREEIGVLPIALGGDIDAFWSEAPADVPQVGLRAALFHPVTGYSLPEAARTAELIARAPVLTSAAVAALIRARSKALWRRRRFLRILNRMMFLAAEPARRYRVLERFYRLPQPLIERFYAGEPALADVMRLLVGEPPVGLRRALAALPERAADARRGHVRS